MNSSGPQAKFSDIVLPVTTSLEREDIGSGGHDGFMIAMSAQIPPVGEARDDYAIFCDLAERLSCGERFSEGATPGSGCGRSTKRRGRARGRGIALPSFDEFWRQGCWNTARRRNRRFSWRIFAPTRSAIRSLRLPARSSFFETIAGFGYRECPGHPWWDEQEAAWQRQEAAPGRCICSPASRAPACTASTITAA